MSQGCHLPPPARHAEHAYRKGLLENHQPQTPCHRQRGMPLLPLQSEGVLRQRLHEHAEQPTLQQAGIAIANLIAGFGQRTYYRARKGERLLLPEEQQSVLNVFRHLDAGMATEFDSYAEGYLW